MKKICFLIVAVLAMISCGSNKNVASLSSLGGEWEIVKIDGSDVAAAEEKPFIGFNLADTLVYGSTGCNQLTGALNADASTGSIDFSALGSTRRMCADMEAEQQVLSALGRVSSFSVAEDGMLLLLDADKKTVIELKHK
ncbi:MAG: META domain-containing protein [Prevotella sp.]|nr:META domain-containing protein [Prevotella sp.]MBR2035141.1 META domain-containing protein [Prevotella sp.]MBR2881184.1 META domain-containing protein [Prevotella sp.]MBR6593535.1 META domain-containing protein [Prevotella sp.]